MNPRIINTILPSPAGGRRAGDEGGFKISVTLIILCSLLLRLILMGRTDLLVEEAYYWNYAQHLDWSYLDHPPMVALLIKISTLIGGNNEFGVRLASLGCWLVTVLFNVKLTRLICRETELYVVLLLSILPFFFLQSFIMTPDQPLLACWSAALFYFYRALVHQHSKSWILAGVWVGLGMLSKYTMVLLGLATILYMISTPSARYWFRRKEPYWGAFIALCLFSPVIYWNATHDWVSFAFQGSRRFHAHYAFALPQWFGLLVIFLTPPGLWGLWTLCRFQSDNPLMQRFFQCYTWVPLLWFGLFSLAHNIRFNWIGPALLGMIPWLALALKQNQGRLNKTWLITATILMVIYTTMASAVLWGSPELLNRIVLKKFIDWKKLTRDFHQLAMVVEQQSNSKVLFAPLDLYNLNSELTFYQHQFLAQGMISKQYPTVARHEFGVDSLMYRYWGNSTALAGKTLILISMDPHDFENQQLQQRILTASPRQAIWSQSQGLGIRMKPYYYQVARIKN